VLADGIVEAAVAPPTVVAVFFFITHMKMTTMKIKNAPPASPPASAPVFAFEDLLGLLLDEPLLDVNVVEVEV
jgi:hypothetical protein